MRSSSVGLAAVVGLAATLAPRADAQRSDVKVTLEDPVITRVDFDPRHPPADMPTLTPPEAGVCDTTFALSAGIGYSLELLSPTTVQIWVDKIEVVGRQQIRIFTIANAPAKLRAHEEGHRVISEHYYRLSAESVRAAATRLIGATFMGSGSDRAAAERDAVNGVRAALEQAYMARTRVPSEAANARFDEITEHGLNAIDEDDAVEQALRVEFER